MFWTWAAEAGSGYPVFGASAPEKGRRSCGQVSGLGLGRRTKLQCTPESGTGQVGFGTKSYLLTQQGDGLLSNEAFCRWLWVSSVSSLITTECVVLCRSVHR